MQTRKIRLVRCESTSGTRLPISKMPAALSPSARWRTSLRCARIFMFSYSSRGRWLRRTISVSYELGNALRCPRNNISSDFGICESAVRPYPVRRFTFGIGKWGSTENFGSEGVRGVCVRYGCGEFKTSRNPLGYPEREQITWRRFCGSVPKSADRRRYAVLIDVRRSRKFTRWEFLEYPQIRTGSVTE